MQGHQLKYAEWYACRDYSIFLWPDEKITNTRLSHLCAAPIPRTFANDTAIAAATAEIWTKHYGVQIYYIENNQPFLVLDHRPALSLIKVLSKDRVGWIICKDWLSFEEVLG